MDSDDDQRMDVDSDSDNEIDENSNANQHNHNIIAGKIAMVHLKNFLTHTEATVYPSEQLNLVSVFLLFLFFLLRCFD